MSLTFIFLIVEMLGDIIFTQTCFVVQDMLMIIVMKINPIQ